ncbi:MAG: hypothetical protein ACLFQ8_02240 [Candidatus Aenigmatarchaeota archaeon]
MPDDRVSRERDYEIIFSDFSLEHSGPLRFVSNKSRSRERIKEACQKVELPEEYLKDYVKLGKETGRRLSKHNESGKLEYGLKRCYERVKDGFTRILYDIWPEKDETLERLERNIDATDLLVKDSILTGDEFEGVDRVEEGEEVLESYEPENSAQLILGTKDGVESKKTTEILEERDFEELIEQSTKPRTGAFLTGTVSRKDPDPVYENRENLRNLEKLLESGYLDDLNRIGKIVPRMYYEALQRDDIRMKDLGNFTKNVNKFGLVNTYGDRFLEQNNGKENELLVKNMADLAFEDLDEYDITCINKTLPLYWKRDMPWIIGVMHEKYQRKGYLDEASWREVVGYLDKKTRQI